MQALQNARVLVTESTLNFAEQRGQLSSNTVQLLSFGILLIFTRDNHEGKFLTVSDPILTTEMPIRVQASSVISASVVLSVQEERGNPDHQVAWLADYRLVFGRVKENRHGYQE